MLSTPQTTALVAISLACLAILVAGLCYMFWAYDRDLEPRKEAGCHKKTGVA